MRILFLAALLGALSDASGALAKPPIPAPPGADALLDRCAAVERVAAALRISGQYLLSDTVDDCGNLLGTQQYRTSETP